jgi:hypothetical protein
MRSKFIEWSGAPEGAAASLTLDGWDFVPLEEGGETLAVAALRGSEIHFAVRPDWRRRIVTRRRARAFLAPLIERTGFLTTRCPHDEPGARKFVERMQFEPTWSDERFTYFILTSLPFSKEH